MNTNTNTVCPENENTKLGVKPFSPLGWSAWLRLCVAACACALLWVVVLWALD